VGGCGLDLSVQNRDQWQAVVNIVINIQVS
jgi:hypothetical protein